MKCQGGHAMPLRRVWRCYPPGGRTLSGECCVCGHVYALNQDGRVRRHERDCTCIPGVYASDCGDYLTDTGGFSWIEEIPLRPALVD